VILLTAVDRRGAADCELGHAEAVALLRRAAEVQELLDADPEVGDERLNWFATRSNGNTSCPALTGVWVVNNRARGRRLERGR